MCEGTGRRRQRRRGPPAGAARSTGTGRRSGCVFGGGGSVLPGEVVGVERHGVLPRDGDGGGAVPGDGDGGAGAGAAVDGAVDEIAVGAAGQAGGEGVGLRGGAVVQRDPALGAAAERDQVHPVVVPVAQVGVADVVVPADHVGHAGNPVGACPPGIAGGVGDVPVPIGRRGRVVGGESEAGVHLRGAVAAGQHEFGGDRIGGVVLVAEGVA